jgi:hypothetical protein
VSIYGVWHNAQTLIIESIVNSLEGMILELEYFMDHEPESGAKQIALLHQYTRHTIAATPLEAFTFV